MQNAGDLTSAYTTISNNGSIKLQNIEKGKYIYLDPGNCNFKISGPTTIQDGTDLPSNENRTDLVNFDYNVDADGLCSYVILKLQSQGLITLNPLTNNTTKSGINIYSFDETSKDHSNLTCDGIVFYDDYGKDVVSFASRPIPINTDFATITNGYNNKGLHMQRTVDGKTLFIIDSLPKSDPGVDGALYSDQNGNLKISMNNSGGGSFG